MLSSGHAVIDYWRSMLSTKLCVASSRCRVASLPNLRDAIASLGSLQSCLSNPSVSRDCSQMNTGDAVLRLPAAPDLWIAGGVLRSGGYTFSATGVGETARAAAALMESERAEAAAFGRSRPADGLGAARTPRAAAEHAIFESRERQAVIAWRHGRARPRKSSASAALAFHDAKRRWRVHDDRERCLFFIQGNVAIAWSAERSGVGFRFGASCRDCAPEAAVAALRELLQMEFGLALIRRKRTLAHELSERELRSLATEPPPAHFLTPSANAVARPEVRIAYRMTRKYHAKQGLHIVRARPLKALRLKGDVIAPYV